MTGQAPLLIPEVVVYLHPIAAAAHPSAGGGWRWAVHAGGLGPAELRGCANAGRATNRQQAAVIGESHGAAVAKALRILGIPAVYRGIRDLDHDPIPPDADPPVGVWREQQEG